MKATTSTQNCMLSNLEITNLRGNQITGFFQQKNICVLKSASAERTERKMIQFRWRRHLLIFEKAISKEKNPDNIIFKEEPSSQKSFDPDNLTKKSSLDIFVKLELERVRYLVSSFFS